MSQITTYTRKRFNPIEPEANLIDLRDIAHALSLTCRGNGHVRHFYSVAQHSIACCREAKARKHSERVQLACLLHDASEAYLSDVTRPVKRKMQEYLEAEAILQGAIWKKYFEEPLTKEEYAQVQKIDDDMMILELTHLLNMTVDMEGDPLLSNPPLRFQPMKEVEVEFLQVAAGLGVKSVPVFRKATEQDIDRIAEIYAQIHTEEEQGRTTIGWVRSIYPTRKTAEDSVAVGDMFVEEVDGVIVAAAKINREQVDVYADAAWEEEAPDEQVMVLHTLVVSPKIKGKGYGSAFVDFYEAYALANGCPYLRMDTNQRNTAARALYKKLGYTEADVVPCVFNGIAGVGLVCLEKKLG